jgi:ASPIC and UnbV/FG-GAP-like repeat
MRNRAPAAACLVIFGLLGAAMLSRQARSEAAAQRPAAGAGTPSMVERLAAIADASDQVTLDQSAGMVFGTNQPHLIPVLRQKIGAAAGSLAQYALRSQLALQLVQAGFSAEALAEFESLQADIAALPESVVPGAQKAVELARLHGAIGVAALRLGEQENCILNHRATSCIFPIDGSGVHSLQRGARRAIDAFSKRLAVEPGNLGVAWLLNLAYMTVGEYPAKVPFQWRIPPDVFASEYDIKRFPDIAMNTGVDVVGLAGGSVIEDFDGDGNLDIVASSWGLRDQLRFFRNDGSGRFADRTKEAGLTGQLGGINLTHADYDNDGDADLLVIRGGWLREAGPHPESLLRNRGDGTFEDVTEAAGLLTLHPTHTAAWGDYDNDGYLDLFLGHEDWGLKKHAVQLFHNNRDGTFTDRAPALGFGVLGVVKGVAWGDYNNDRLPDLYVSRFGLPNLLYRNDGGTGFTDVTAIARVAEPVNSFPTWFFDYDNDGWLDIFVGGFDESSVDAVASLYRGVKRPGGTPRLYRNKGDGTFEDVTTAAKLDRVLLAMGANFGDLDNDGFLDVYVGTGAPDLSTLLPNRMFRNAGGKFFQDVTTSGGFGHLQKGHGISFGDLDNDGDQDIYEVIGGWFSGDSYQNVLFENPGHGRQWITLAIEGRRSNRAGIGARLKVRVAAPGGPRTIYATVSTGGSYGSSSLQQELGLGDASSIESIEILWPVTGETQVFRDVAMNQFVRIREGSATIERLNRKPFQLARSPAADHRH